MDNWVTILFEITSLESQLSGKKNEYLQEIKNGASFDELKKIFLEVRTLEEKLNVKKDIKSTILKRRSNK